MLLIIIYQKLDINTSKSGSKFSSYPVLSSKELMKANSELLQLSSAKLSCLVFKTNLKFCQTTYINRNYSAILATLQITSYVHSRNSS